MTHLQEIGMVIGAIAQLLLVISHMIQGKQVNDVKERLTAFEKKVNTK
jgi:hypothetical protein